MVRRLCPLACLATALLAAIAAAAATDLSNGSSSEHPKPGPGFSTGDVPLIRFRPEENESGSAARIREQRQAPAASPESENGRGLSFRIPATTVEVPAAANPSQPTTKPFSRQPKKSAPPAAPIRADNAARHADNGASGAQDAQADFLPVFLMPLTTLPHLF